MVQISQSLTLLDRRPFFEKVLAYGVANGIIHQVNLTSIQAEAPKGMVQIARYFGSEYLRPELELARERIVNLVSLYLEHSTDGNLHQAAESLRDHSFLSRSKGGSDMLKALLAMPQSSHFGMGERHGFTDDHIPLLAKWTLRSLDDYRREVRLRQRVAQLMDAALWLANALDADDEEMEEAGCDAEALIRTALLTLAHRQKVLPNWVAFEKMILQVRKRAVSGKEIAIELPKGLPEEHHAVVSALRDSIVSDLPRMLDTTHSLRKLFHQTPALMGRYFWREDALGEVDHFEQKVSAAWDKATGGHSDDGSLLTLFLCIASGTTTKTLLTSKSAMTLLRKIRKSGWKPELASSYITANAPPTYQSDYLAMWESFVEEEVSTLLSDHDYDFYEAMAVLRQDCNIS
jgi:hypothetical protein